MNVRRPHPGGPHRGRPHQGYGYQGYRGYRGGPPPQLLLVVALLVGMGAITASAAFVLLSFVMLTLAPMIVTGVAAVVVHRRRRRTRGARRAGVGAASSAPATRDQALATWVASRERFAALRSDYARHECDPIAVLRLPALQDVTVPSTARFIETFAEAQALDSDHRPPASHATAFSAAVDRACRAWEAAVHAAERIRLSGLSASERAAVERVVKLLTMAQETDSEFERLTAYAKARSELGRLERTGTVHLPRPAQAALDAASRGQLSA